MSRSPRLRAPRPGGRTFRPVLVTVEEGDYAGEYQVHLGKPGRPRVYRVLDAHGRVARLHEGNPALTAVANAMRDGIAKRKAMEAAEESRRSTWHYRVRAWIGRTWARLWAWRPRWSF